jgi:hypothetical protein
MPATVRVGRGGRACVLAVSSAVCTKRDASDDGGVGRVVKTLIWIGGLVQLGIVGAALWVPRVMNWRQLLAPLHPFMRRLFWVYAAFIMGVNLCFGAISVTQAGALASGGSLSRLICGFIALYWLARLAVQLFVFDVRPLVRSRLVMFGHYMLTAAFIYLAAVYGWAAAHPWKEILQWNR